MNIRAIAKTMVVGSLALGALVPVAAGAAKTNGGTTAPSNTPYCTFGVNVQRSISVNGSVATATFRIPSHCPALEYSLVSYKAPNNTDGQPFSSQKYFASTTKVLGPGLHTITTTTPDCYYQIDLIKGRPITQLSNGGTYAPAGRLITAVLGGPKPCDVPGKGAAHTTNNVTVIQSQAQAQAQAQATPAASASTSAASTPAANAQAQAATPEATTAVAAAQLPETGAAGALGGLTGMGAIGYAVQRYVRSRKSLAEKLLKRD